MLADPAKKNEDAAKAQFDLDGNTDSYIATLRAGHQAVYDNAIALGATADQAQAIADKVAAIPSEKQVQIIADTAQAAKTIDQFIAQYGHLSGTIMFRSQNLPAGTPGTFASGGYTGSGSPAAVAGVVHGREFVSNARTTANPSNRAALEYMQAGGVVRGYARGGYVMPVYSQAPVPWSSGDQQRAGSTVPVNIKVTGETDPYAFAALAGQAVAARVRGIK
jgi:hypothetical protein